MPHNKCLLTKDMFKNTRRFLIEAQNLHTDDPNGKICVRKKV